ncbi:endo-beta-N-acetylglucosaminidase [Streptomyces sp. NBC_00536]|uniref:endo-beta-N-acetylglucosaminidase n=1 Tax=Streptomyces sp. NBC_00536 TaxID=2975769 RepID=UPI002E80FCDF|nr:endo-beta-N-acetylglucosaminidase [Streptomyces sp. NBC_00536]WUC81662.1 endo-beta-N-acetylglucosaminidase [Streptomyces sp. NBC_00536]
MSETDNGVDARSIRPTRRGLLLAGAGAGAGALLGAPGPAAAATAAPRAPLATGQSSATAQDRAPYASYWFPDSLPAGSPGAGIVWRSLKQWRAETDPDLAHNTASVPLAARFTPVAANATARAGQARISSLVSFGPTAGNPSQGGASADYYALTHWAYLDELVFWGGSAGEGIVLAPNAPVVDAAHRNGVRVLGNVFLPPVAYGGDLQWTRDLVQQDSLGRYPIAERLAEVAAAYGFDGWFVNAETDGGDSELATRMRGFLRALRAAGEPKGLRITWYDAMNSTGRVGWRGALDPSNQEFFEDRQGKVADTMFVDFRWSAGSLAASGTLAGQLGRDRYELWAGVDVESAGWNTDPGWDAIVPRGRDHVVSYGFYRPEWTRNHLTDRSPGAFHAADDRFWTGESLDPSRPAAGSAWRAPASVVADRSTVTALPFASTFNTGHGLRWYENGTVTSPAPWNHLGLQDRLPGRRWVVASAGPRPAVTLDFADAWRGGSSLLVAGALTAAATVGLHATRLPLTAASVLELVYRTESGAVDVEVGIAVREPSKPGGAVPYTWLKAQAPGGGQGWRTARVPLSALAGKTAYGLAVRLTRRGTAAVRWRLGSLSVADGAERPAAPGGARVDSAVREGAKVSLRLSWQRAPGAVRHHELYRMLPDGTRRFLGGTCGTALYVPGLERSGQEPETAFEVRAVSELYAVSAPVSTSYAW